MENVIAVYVECPFFKYTRGSTIVCENRNQPFETVDEKKAYVKEYCKKLGTCKECINHKNLMKKYEEGKTA